MRNLLLFFIATICGAATLPLYIDTDTNTVVSPDAPTTLDGYGITDAVGGTPTLDAFLVGDGAAWVTQTGETAQKSLGVVTNEGGGTVGDSTTATTGGAVGAFANSNSGGGAVGFGASSTAGGAVGEGAYTLTGGSSGDAASSTSGGSAGEGAMSTTGGAIGSGASSTNGFAGGASAGALSGGGAVGASAIATTGFAGGSGSAATDGFAGGNLAIADGTGRVQLGTGTNIEDSTIQFLSSGSVTAAEFGRLAVSTTAATGSTYTVLSTDQIVLANNSGGVAVALISAASAGDGFRLVVKNTGTGAVTIDADGTETIDGALTAILTNQYESITIVSDGSNWFIL